MEMVRVSLLGITGIVLGFLLKGTRPEYSFYVSLGIGVCILMMAVGKLDYLYEALETIRETIPIDSGYLSALLKMIGIAYVGQFTSGICKDAGYAAIGGQIELFGKLVIMSLSMPILLALLETVHAFLE